MLELKGFEKGICFDCANFDIDVWIQNENKSEAVRGALACRSNGIAGENNIACNCFERAGDA
jgi:hypothetical protein